MTKTKMPRDRQKRQCPVAAPFFLFNRVFGCISDLSEGVSKILKRIFARNASRKSFCGGEQTNPKSFFSRFFLSRFWAFLGEGSSKLPQKECWEKNI
jgi:hypothetical protein